jgi:predicted helicase
MVAKHSGLTIPDGVEASAPFVQILDPATGTGTFLVEVIDLIEKHLKNKWRKAGKSDKETMVLWNEYVPSHLLPRLNGFELMMAPYAIAHIKLGMKLQETGYRPHPAAPRVRVFLTNTLERPDRDDHQTEMGFILESLASEAKGAALIKKSRSNTVIIGNPPYSRNSFNLAPEHRQHVDRFRSINGLPIVQRGHLELERAIQNDYVKFISFALSQLSNSKLGVSGLITSNSFRAAQLLGGLRYHWLDQVSALSIVDLHGYAQGTGMALVDGADQNVFSILEGVAIHFSRMVFGKTGNVIDAQDIRGSRAKKYEWLLSQGLTLGSSIEPKAPRYLMVEINDRSAAEYENWTPIDEIFSIARGAIVTARDRLVIDFDRADLLERIVAFQQTSDVREASIRLGARWSGAWANEGKGARAHQSIQRRSSDDLNADCVLLNYRPFDFRWLFYCDNFLDTPARAVMSGILKGGAIGLAIGKSTRNPSPDHFLASSHSVEAKCAESSKQCHFIPLLIQENNLGFETLRPNLEKDFIAKLSRSTDLGYHNNSDLVPISGNGSNFAPMDVFGYIYSILYSRSYRDRYSSLLRSDFPRMPWSPSNILFRELSRIGVELARLHTLSPDCDALRMPVTRFISKATPIVELGYPKYENGKVMINASCWFEDVTREVWDFHIGGYQVCEKWMKARSAKGGQNPTPGRVLTNDDALHFRRITVALSETIRLMAEIDKVIDEHGGWPDAFAAA